MGRERVPWTSQPQQPTGPDWGNPLCKGLASLISGTSRYDTVSRRTPYAASGPYTIKVGRYGKRQYLDFVGGAQEEYVLKKFSGDFTLFLVGGLRAGLLEIQPIVAVASGSTKRIWFGENQTQLMRFTVHPSGGGAVYVEDSLSSLGDHVYVGTLQGSVMTLYRDGILIGTSTQGVSSFTDVATLRIGDNTSLFGEDANLYAAGLVLRAWTATEVKAFSANPWQLFEPLPDPRALYAPSIFNVSSLESFSATDSPSAALTLSSDIAESITITATESAVNSVTRPNSDVTTTGWTATPGPDLFDMIDEVTASDTDYITSPDLTSGASTTIHGLTQSLAVGTYTVRFRSEKATAPTRSVRIHLMDGTSTIVGSSGWQAVTASYALYEVSITTSALATRVGIEAQ